MKKNSILIATTLVIVSVVAYAFTSKETPEPVLIETIEPITKSVSMVAEAPKKDNFYYNLSPRFEPMKRSDLLRARSFQDFITEDLQDKIQTYYSVRLMELESDAVVGAIHNGSGSELNQYQLEFLKSRPLSTNLKISSEYIWYNEERGITEDGYATPHKTIVPEIQAVHKDGNEALVESFRHISESLTKDLDEQKLGFAKWYFTVDIKGNLKHIWLDRSCGYPEIDQHVKALLEASSGQWVPARDMNGELVKQELTFSFGKMGC